MAYKNDGAEWAAFGHSMWDVLVDLENDNPITVELRISPSRRRRVVQVSAVATHIRPGAPPAEVCRVQGEYPNSRASTLVAYLFWLVNQLARQVEDWRRDQEREQLSRPMA